ncbi:MAG: ZIP family metal transporter [Nanoarchaeota archaeon]
MLSILTWIIIITVINGLLAFAGLIFFFNSHKTNRILILLVSFTTGALIGGAFFHFIPESLEKLTIIQTTSITIIGFILFLFLEKILYWRHCHDGKCDEHPFTYLLLYGDAVHNFVDGLIIAASFLISIPFGFITSLLVLIHELPQEISDLGVLVYGGLTKRKALFYNFLAQLTSVLGGILGYFYLSLKDQAIFLLPLSAGGFLYIAISDLIPEIFKEKNITKLTINLIFIILGLGVLISAKILAG